MKVNKENCTKEILGRVKEVQVKGQDFPAIISVEYQVGDVSYVVIESIKLKSETIKVGFFPIGQKKVPVMGETAVGSPAIVNYNPENPAEAYITNNTGRVNA